jgi:transcriptional regulator with XRE-family HTH domain
MTINPRTLDDELLRQVQQRVAERIRSQRIALRISQESAADALGVTQPTWSRIERGLQEPGLTQLIRIVNLLDIDSVEGLIGRFPSRDLHSNEG